MALERKKVIWTILKLILSITAFYFAFKRIDIKTFGNVLAKTQIWYLIPGLLLYTLSQVVSSKRLQIILKQRKDEVGFLWNLKLYFLGMAYNLFLPGGIGGDAYKIFAYSKKLNQPAKRYFVPILGDRLIGLVAIIALLSFCVSSLPDTGDWWTKPPWLVISVFGIFIGYAAVIKWFKEYQYAYFRMILLSVGIQIIQIVGLIFIIQSIGVGIDNLWFVFSVFLISTLATAVPVFLGGLGAREVVFASLFPVFGMYSETGILIAILFSIIVIASSLPGLLFAFSRPDSVR